MGTLYIVPTPVGNMEDMTLRAIRILKEADLVLAEDTRTSGILLKHFDIQNHLMSHHKFNEHGTASGIVERLKAGQTVAFSLPVRLPAQASLCKPFPGLRRAYLPLFRRDCLATAFALKVFCRRRRDGRPIYSRL